MEQARLPCQPHPGYGYHPAEAWMPARGDSGTAPADAPVLKFHSQRSSPYPPPGPLLGGSRLSASPSSSGPRSAMARRNERERKRVRLVNHGFATLRQYLPQGNHARKKLSKMETLRSAIEYIKQLQFLLDPTSATSSSATPSPPLYGEPSSDPSWPQSGPPSWDDSWAQQQQPQRSPSPHTSLSPETDLIDFAAFS